jgi:4-amino-4-deoxy-L-arabinose transferase-like glycosyltransferase
VVAAVLLAFAPRYGFHRDELYFMANADHPAWGYVDHPPVTPLLGWLSQQMFGDSLFGLRVVPALVAAGVVVAAGAVATELGGGRTAAAVAAWATASTATVLALGHMLTTPTVDVLVWTTAIWVLCRIVRTHDGRWFLLLGAIVGVGLLNKFTVLLAVASFGAALAMLPQRRVLATPWILAGAALAAAMWSPNLWWQATHGWPVFELSAGVADEATENRILAIPFQALFLGLPIATAVTVGWWRQLRGRALRDTRFISLGFVLLLALVIVSGGKPYYAAGALPALTAVATVELVDWIRRHLRLVASLIALNGAVTALLVLPILPATIVVDSPASAVNPEPLEMIGWPQFVDRIADEYERIDDGTRTAVILTGNYGEAGAIDRFGPDRGLPPAYSGHNSYADFRQPPGSAGPVLVVGYRAPGAFLVGCRELDPIVMPDDVDNEEQGAPLWRCDAPSRPWHELWPDIRHID